MYRWRAFESVWSELLKKDQSSHPNLWKAPNYDEQQIWPSWNILKYLEISWNISGLKLHTKKQWSRLSLRTIEHATNTNKKYFYTFRISQITFTHGERKKERPRFYGMFSQNLLNSAAFTAILKMKLPQCNVMGVRTPPGCHGIQIQNGQASFKANSLWAQGKKDKQQLSLQFRITSF